MDTVTTIQSISISSGIKRGWKIPPKKCRLSWEVHLHMDDFQGNLASLFGDMYLVNLVNHQLYCYHITIWLNQITEYISRLQYYETRDCSSSHYPGVVYHSLGTRHCTLQAPSARRDHFLRISAAGFVLLCWDLWNFVLGWRDFKCQKLGYHEIIIKKQIFFSKWNRVFINKTGATLAVWPTRSQRQIMGSLQSDSVVRSQSDSKRYQQHFGCWNPCLWWLIPNSSCLNFDQKFDPSSFAEKSRPFDPFADSNIIKTGFNGLPIQKSAPFADSLRIPPVECRCSKRRWTGGTTGFQWSFPMDPQENPWRWPMEVRLGDYFLWIFRTWIIYDNLV